MDANLKENQVNSQPAGDPATTSSYKWVMLVVALFIQMNGAFAIQAIGPSGPFIRKDLGMSYSQFGLIFTAINLGTLLLMTWAGTLCDNRDSRKIFLIGGCGVGIALAICSLANAPWQILLILFVAGLFNSVGGPSSVKPIAMWFTGKGRATAMGFKQCAIPFAGLICGMVFPTIATKFGWHTMFLIDGIWCCFLAIICYLLYREPEGFRANAKAAAGSNKPKVKLKDVLNRDLLLVSIGCLFLNGVQYTFSNYLVSYMNEVFKAMAIASAAVLAGTYFSMTNLGGIIGRLGLGVISDRLLGGRRKGLLIVVNVIAICVVLVFMIGGKNLPPAVMGILAVIFGLTGVSFTGIQISLAIEVAGDWKVAGTASGFTLALCFGGMMLVPPIFGAVLDAAGWTWAWIALAIIGIIGIAFLLPIKEKAGHH
jgi:sugar phosphate permease